MTAPPPQSVEELRLQAGLTQLAVTQAIGISQPHYSKVVGGLVLLSPELAEQMAAWVKVEPSNGGSVRRRSNLNSENSLRIQQLSRSIERQLRELNSLLELGGIGSGRRAPTPTKTRRSNAPGEGR